MLFIDIEFHKAPTLIEIGRFLAKEAIEKAKKRGILKVENGKLKKQWKKFIRIRLQKQ